MIKTVEPIQLKTAQFGLKDNGFEERIRANYMLMGSNISSETLTHMLNTPPEILIAEGDSSVTGINNTSFSFTEVQQTLINNAVNRILISGDMALNYQDRVFITSVLNKLGIRDERRFMNEVRDMLSETKNSLRLTRLYMNNASNIRDLVRLSREERPESEKTATEEKEPDTYINRLYLNIMNRLKTGMIYQIVENMNMSQTPGTLLTTEVNNSEQSYTARQLLLQRYREISMGEAVPFIYRADNVFEEETREGGPLAEETIRERINSAAFLEVIRSIDHVTALKTESESKQWTDVRESFYKTADNVLTRILMGAREHRSAYHFEDTALSFIDNIEKNEINALSNLIYSQSDSEELFSYAYESYNNLVSSDRFSSTEEILSELDRIESAIYESELFREFREADVSYLESDTEHIESSEEYHHDSHTEETLRERRDSSDVTREIERSRERSTEETYRENFTEAGMTYLESEASETLREDSSSSELRSEIRSELTRERERELREQTQRDRERTLETEHTDSLTETGFHFLRTDNNETLEHELERINESNKENVERYKEIRRILLSSQKTKNVVSDRERTLRESLKSLNNKEHLMKLLESEETNNTAIINNRLEQVYKLLPPETVAILKQLDVDKGKKGDDMAPGPEGPAVEADINNFLTKEVVSVPQPYVPEPVVYREQEIPEEVAHLDVDGIRIVRELIERVARETEERAVEASEKQEKAASGKKGKGKKASVPEQELVHVSESTETEVRLTDSQIRNELIREVFNETGVLEFANDFETLLNQRLKTEERLIEENERLTRIEQNPAETVFLESLLSEKEYVPAGIRQITRRAGEFRNLVNMVYKVNETLTEEDVMERLEEFRRTNAREAVTVTEAKETVTNVSQVKPVQISEVSSRELGKAEREEIANMIETGVRRQLGLISNEVYTRLEKRLKNEKARRGY